MPSRLIGVLVVGFWLVTVHWWVTRELAPRLDAGEPPPFVIDLADEVRSQGMPIAWTVLRDEKQIGLAHFEVRRWPNDTYYMDGTTTFTLEMADLPRAKIYLKNSYHITTEGKLLDLTAEISIEMLPRGELPDDLRAVSAFTVEGHMAGQVRGQRLHPAGWLAINGAKKPLSQQPRDLAGHSSVINPMHPVNRIGGLRPGQTWIQPIFEPLAAALAARFPGFFDDQPRRLLAQVQPEPQPLAWDRQSVPCLVIHYSDDEVVQARTWLREKDGLVLRQEVQAGPLGWLVLQRNPESNVNRVIVGDPDP